MLNRDQIAHEYIQAILSRESTSLFRDEDFCLELANNCFNLADAMIAEAEKRKSTERPSVVGDGWISVEDRLPEDGQQVLIYSEETYIASATYREAKPKIGCDKDDGSGWFSDEVYGPNVTHWHKHRKEHQNDYMGYSMGFDFDI